MASKRKATRASAQKKASSKARPPTRAKVPKWPKRDDPPVVGRAELAHG